MADQEPTLEPESGVKTSIDDEGRLNFWLDEQRPLPPVSSSPVQNEFADPRGGVDCPPLNIAIFIVGSRGDVQPYIALALELIRTRGHRVRIATHGDFKELVLGANDRLSGEEFFGKKLEGRLEFFDVGGNPKELMAYMVKNPGLLPGWAALTSGDVGAKQKMTKEYLRGFARSVSSPDPQTGRQFAADAIISNPPAFAHIHIAEALGIPLLLSFTMPWTSTSAYVHPLVNIKRSSAEPAVTNYLSYALADNLVWSGLGGVINRFRTDELGLLPLAPSLGPLLCERLHIPVTYAWSEALLPKPADWKNNIDIVGFYTLPALKEYKPDPDLVKFLEAGPPPVYIGFGSIVVDNPDELTSMIVHAVGAAGVRALVSAGWADLGSEGLPESIFLIKGDVSHEWLFSEGRVAAVCHHGGAGTSAVGLKHGRPTIVIPFFGDQRFWGDSIHRAGAGPAPIPYKALTGESLAEGLMFATSEGAQAAAATLGERIMSENAQVAGVRSFHRHLPLRNMRCELDRTRNALWWSDKYCLRLSGAAAMVLTREGKVRWGDLKPHRPIEYATNRHYSDPLNSTGTALYDMVARTASSTGQLFYAPHRAMKGFFYDVPKSGIQTIGALHEGVQNVPGLIGSDVRRPGEVNSFASGAVEGGKSFALGVWDGFTGLVTEPVVGGMKEGPMGFVKGCGRGMANFAARPIGGMLSLVVLPTQGAYLETKRRMSSIPPKEEILRYARQAASEEEVEHLSDEQRARMLERWGVVSASRSVKARRAALEKQLLEAEAILLDSSKVKKPKIEAGVPRRVHAPAWVDKGDAVGSEGSLRSSE